MKHAGSIAALLLVTGLATLPAVALADVRDGVDAWGQGDFAKAIREWTPLAAAGDADAQFNMGQAYKLGRGVTADFARAIDFYRKAAVQGHERAIDNLGLLLFQQNQRKEAMPWLIKSADRGEARAQYLVGLALFNGDLVAKNWTKAYALMTLAQQQGLSQAGEAIEKMDAYIPQDQRMAGLTLAGQMAQAQRTEPRLADATKPPANTKTPHPVEKPAALRSAEARPSLQTTESKPKNPVAATASSATPNPVTAISARPSAAPKPGTAPATSGNWRIQLGAFSEAGRAETLWKSLRGKVSALSDYQRFLVPGGTVTRLQVGPLPSRDEAGKLCSAIKAAGTDCIVKPM